MHNTIRYNIAKCCIEKSCKNCNSFGDAIVVDRGTHHSLYCAKCGAFIKHASSADKRHIYLSNVKVEDSTPFKVWALYDESSKTMTTKK